MGEWHNLICGAMLVILPASMAAQDASRAILHSAGGVWLNGAPAPASAAIFPLDFIQTRQQSPAKIDAEGSSVTVQPESIVQFNGDELVLDHGSVQVSTARAWKIRVNCLTISPATAAWTRYNVTDVDRKVIIVAIEKDVKLDLVEAKSKSAAREVIVRAGEQAMRDEACGPPNKASDAVDARGAILNDPWAIGAGSAAIAALTCWALCFQNDDPVSPSKP